MTWVGYTLEVNGNLCPHCDGPLLELSDMWGPFYACEGCGYEVDQVELEMERPRPNGKPVFAAGLSLAQDDGSGRGQTISSASEEAPRLPLAS